MGEQSRTNDLLDTVESGGVALGVLDSVYSPELAEFYGELGLDFVWLDLEHAGPSPWNGQRLNDLLRAAESGGTEALVRIPEPDPGMVRKALDAGVRNLFVSRVEEASDARRALRAARFDYDGDPGDRGFANPRASRWGLADDYARTEDEETMIGVTIESPTAVDNIDEILDVPDLGFVFLGPLDLAVSLGHPGEPDHPEVQELVEEARAAAVDAGVPVGGLGFGMDDVNEKADEGYQILNVGSTTGALAAAAESWLGEFEGER